MLENASIGNKSLNKSPVSKLRFIRSINKIDKKKENANVAVIRLANIYKGS